MSNSSLISCSILTNNYGNYVNGARVSDRAYPISKITIHHMAGNLSVESCLRGFQNPSRQASANYVIGTDGRIGLGLEESKRPWTSGSYDNDNRAITIEVANDEIGGQWHVSDKALASLINLCEDICRRNNIKQLNFTGNANGNLTQHNYFQATACPAAYLKSKFPYIADEVNRRLNGVKPTNNVDVYYSAYAKKQWLDTVKNCNDKDCNGYAGWDGNAIQGIACSVTQGHIVYRVHTVNGKWLDWVQDLDKAQGGFAGLYGKNIDGVQIFLKDLPNKKVQYRVRLTNGKYLGWVTNYDNTANGYAGIYGKTIDRVQIKIV